ncbi:HNH endonuclease [Seonamhaeicola sediminis]|uniref:HNH endonuclease n=1 Tax=Seonamhaeicola sediminis TaxID=2528206 RepID=A0A562YIF6_9FLAO|nr:HNH endonuclease [Seonamhaeicola sediminis]TWO34754.1 HNH endonuclease [Seonamhaeicola sediminis]
MTTFNKEEWKILKRDYWKENEVYQVSNHGRVIRYKINPKGEFFKFSIVSGGYEAFTAIKKNKKSDLQYIHRVVAELFIENPEKKRFVIHKDFDKSNNHYANLNWATQKELVKHNLKNPLVIASKERKKNNPPYSKLSEGKVKIIKRKIFDPNRKTRLRLIAKQFGISEMQLYRIKTGENWGHVTDF